MSTNLTTMQPILQTICARTDGDNLASDTDYNTAFKYPDSYQKYL